MADLTATRLFKKWKAFDLIPPAGQGSISYEDLATKLDADTSLVSMAQSPIARFERLLNTH
jgi:cysteine sulfinate desulfinase/cysteine desulfurase-like protein